MKQNVWVLYQNYVMASRLGRYRWARELDRRLFSWAFPQYKKEK